MRITDRYQSTMDRVGSAGARPVDKTTAVEGGPRGRGNAAGGALEVTVSERAQELASGAARLEELRSAIRDGSFRVDSQRIAEKLVGLLGGEGC